MEFSGEGIWTWTFLCGWFLINNLISSLVIIGLFRLTTSTQNLWDAAKAVLTGKFIAIQSYLRLTISSWDSFSSLYLSRNMCISFSDGLIHNYVPYSLTFLFILIISVAMAPLSFLFVGIWVYSLFFFKFLHFKCL